MIGTLADCSQLPHNEQGLYRELLVADSQDTLERVKYYRHSKYQAVTAARMERVPANEQECQEVDEAQLLLTVLATSVRQEGIHRYDKVIILKRGEADNIEELVQFFRSWIPRLIREGRVFVATMPERVELNEEVFDRLFGQCKMIGEDA